MSRVNRGAPGIALIVVERWWGGHGGILVPGTEQDREQRNILLYPPGKNDEVFG